MDAAQFIQRFQQDLRALGVRPGGVLLVHSSLRSLGWVPGGPESVVCGLLELLGDQGTLVMPALSYETVTSRHPVFDLRTTPACVGAIPEYFRLRTGTHRSLHPTHSVCAVGALAARLLQDHWLDETPCGPHSPFSRLPEFNGQILFLGCGLAANTSMHAVEELVEPPYLLHPAIVYQLTGGNGHCYTQAYQRHNFRGWEQRYERIAGLLNPPDLKVGQVLAAQCHLMEAPAFQKAALAALQTDPFYFVEAGEPGKETED